MKSVMKALNCPFLTRFPVGHVRQYANELLTMADRCPIMGHVIKHTSTSSGNPATPFEELKQLNSVPVHDNSGDAKKCPFVASTDAQTSQVLNLTTAAEMSLKAGSKVTNFDSKLLPGGMLAKPDTRSFEYSKRGLSSAALKACEKQQCDNSGRKPRSS